MHGVRPCGFRNAHECVDGEVTLRRRRRADEVRLVGHQDVQRLAIDLRIHGDGRDALLAARADDARGDLSTVCDEDLADGGHARAYSATALAAASTKLVSTSTPTLTFSCPSTALAASSSAAASVTTTRRMRPPCKSNRPIIKGFGGKDFHDRIGSRPPRRPFEPRPPHCLDRGAGGLS